LANFSYYGGGGGGRKRRTRRTRGHGVDGRRQWVAKKNHALS